MAFSFSSLFGGDDLAPLVLDAATSALGLRSPAPPPTVLQDLGVADIRLPEAVTPLFGPDATGAAATGDATIPRGDAFTYAALAAAPRLVDSLEDAGTPPVAGAVVGGAVFDILGTYEDPASGFRAVHLRERDGGGRRDVFAIDGTENGSAADVVADLDLGRPQAASPEFRRMVEAARDAAVIGDRDIVVTGASLGGAVAQVAGYEIAEAILAVDPARAERVTLMGIDALGGRDAAEDLNGGALDPAVLARLNALNLRTEGDPVSRVGSAVGASLTLPAVDGEGQPVVLPADEVHVNVESLFTVLSSDALYAQGVRGDPAEVGAAALLAGVLGPLVSDVYADLDPALAARLDRPEAARLPGVSGFDASGGAFDLDANADGSVDLRLFFAAPAPPDDPLGFG